MSMQKPKLIHSAPKAIAILLVSVVAFYAIALLVVGAQVTGVSETPIEEINNADPVPFAMSIEYVPYPPAIVPFLAAVLMLTGLIGRKKIFAWIGLGILLVFSLLFLFSSGAILLPIGGLLLVLLPLINYLQNKSLIPAEMS